ncbi:MAG TPA: carboxymuconolactone decarboxylase family protein [Longimicrobium sp.]|jgi:4-carboxymuconolactone decarboxylase
MKRIITTVSLVLLAPAAVLAQTRGASTPPVPATQDAGRITVSRSGSRPTAQAPATNFTGVARLEVLFGVTETTRAGAGLVTFEPGARSAWHTHPRGQTLIVTAGTGRVQRWGAPAEEIRQGDVVWIPAGVKHWHGAAPTTAMAHIAISEQLDGQSVTWLEKVTDAQYGGAVAARASSAAEGPSAAQRLMGDIAPKLAELTDSVLFADVWARPGLSQRDRSLATVSALIAMNRPDQLRSHLTRARANGLTQEEAVEVITHLAFYAGWPSAVTAVGIAREVYQGVDPNETSSRNR